MNEDNWSPPDLAETVALVTGASRGVGRGTAVALGRAGATVYVTGRSTRRGPVTTEGLVGTVEETAEIVTAAGGTGIAVRCDHTVDSAVDALFGMIIRTHGRLDLLVNNAWCGYERSAEARFDAPFWDQPAWRYDLFACSLRAQYIAAQHAARLMLPAGRGLIVGINYTDGDTYLGQAAYDMVKSAANRLSLGMAMELRRYGIGSLSLLPGLVRTERVEAVWSALGDGPAAEAHSPEYVGRAVAMLLADPDVYLWSGRVLTVGDLAVRYGFTDVDGRRPPPFTLDGRMSLATRMAHLHRVAGRSTRAAAPATRTPSQERGSR
jgi:NAD(P)-dependent dehydrogenase (short-subunit alcohol dehydrogenase family)